MPLTICKNEPQYRTNEPTLNNPKSPFTPMNKYTPKPTIDAKIATMELERAHCRAVYFIMVSPSVTILLVAMSLIMFCSLYNLISFPVL